MNQFPNTKKQLEIYRELNTNKVRYCLIGALAAMFYGRNRMTLDIDIMLEASEDNCTQALLAMKKLGYPILNLNSADFTKYSCIRISGKAIVDFHSTYFGVGYDTINRNWFEYDGVQIPVIAKEDLIRLMSLTGVNGEDLRILRLLDDPINNADEINNSQ